MSKETLLSEMKILGQKIIQMLNAGHITGLGKEDPNGESIPGYDSYKILTTDPEIRDQILQTFAQLRSIRDKLVDLYKKD